MKASNVTKAVALAMSVAWAAGCSTTSSTDTGNAGSATGTSASTQGTEVSGGISSAEMAAQKAAEAASLQSVFYFDFDKSVVKQDGFDALEKHAAYLAATPRASVRVEGHADERGTREYNMALGERRANSVARFLQVNGVNASQIDVISYGEEKPAMQGHSDVSWAQNRRVELKYVSN